MSLSHIDALIRGHDLPQPALSRTVVRAVLDTFSDSWSAVCANYPQDVRLPEVDVSKHLAIEFSHRCKQDVRLRRAVAKAITGPESLNFDGSSLQKRPDIAIEWRAGDRLSPLIVECKLIDAPERKTVELYSEKGILRFVDGTYAWSEQEAVMVAFVRDNSKVNSLTEHLGIKGYVERFLIEEFPLSVLEEAQRAVATTKHGRSFAYPLRPGVLPGTITVWHLWLDVVNVLEPQLTAA